MKRTIQGILLTGSLVLGGAALAQGTTTQGGMQGGTQGNTQGSMQGGTQGSTQGQTMKDTHAKAGKSMAKGGVVEHMGFIVPADEKAFLDRLHHINQTEIRLGKLAQQNGQSQDVKSYGEMLVRDHTANDQKLSTYAQTKGHTLAKTPRPLDDMERKAMTAEKAMIEKLETLKGAAFDASFLAHMVSDHDMALGKVMAAQQNFTEGEVATLLQQTSQSVSSHRQQAYSLLGRNGPAVGMGVGGAGTGSSTTGELNHKSHMNTGMGGTGDLDKGQSGTAGDNKNTTGTGGTQKKQ
jgi:putative membrane protein